MELEQWLEKTKFDTRMIDINLQNGKISKNDLEKYYSSHSDISENAELINLDEASSENQDENENQ